MSLKALQDYTAYARYAKYIPEKKRRETWNETVDRVFNMHITKYGDKITESPEMMEAFEFAKKMVREKKVLGSQRALQFGGKSILKHESKIYNCAFTHIARPRVFQEVMFLLLCGCGVGFSVQKKHVTQLPQIIAHNNTPKTFVIEDSIEGWANAVGALLNSYFAEPLNEFKEYNRYDITFDGSLIRPEGALITGGFKAPGPKGLLRALEKIKKVIETRLNSDGYLTDKFAGKLRPIDAYDIIMHSSDAVLSGGVRRSATISIFSLDDDEMANAKTGDWFGTNPQRARSNNSAALLRGSVTKEQFHKLMECTRHFGEPGFIWVDDEDIGYNPCVEIALYPLTLDGRQGVQFCNLCSMNGKKIKTEQDFLDACKASAILGTIQAGYTNFSYLSPETKEITEREALLGCSMTGVMDSPEILLDAAIQRKGAKLIKQVNQNIAKLLGINPAARTCCLKPEGSVSCILGTSSGIHVHHARRYIRRVQANKLEFPAQLFQKINPLAVEESVWSSNNTDVVISFLCEVPEGSITKNQISAIEFLEKVKLTQQNWVEHGTNIDLCINKRSRHNVSNTITVKPEEWDEVEKYIYKNREWFAGISLLPYSGDLDYAQAPFSTILTPKEIVKEYGDASIFASGVVVEGLQAFENNLWKACNVLLNRDVISLEGYLSKPWDASTNITHKIFKIRKNWLEQAIKFANKYFADDITRMSYCLKHVYLWKTWCDLHREYKEIDWSDVVEENEYTQDIDQTGATACAGGACTLTLNVV
jgi:ribonucleoside-diphosphate reductase alpha chain